MNSNKDETILARWLSGELSEEELQSLSAKEDLHALRQNIDRLKELDYPRLTGEELWAKMGTTIMNTPKTLPNRKQKSTKVNKGWSRRLAIAASLLLLVGLLFWILNSTTQNSLYVTAGEHSQQQWIDGSVAVVNADSEVAWNEDWEAQRLVQLKGEAFFIVTKGKPFVVQSSAGKVEVLGTQFNVFDRGDIFKVVCYEGRVKVIKAGEETILSPGQGVAYHGASQQKLQTDLTQPAWTTGKSTFQKADLALVFEALERQYNITLEVEANIDGRQFTGQFPHDDLTKALQLIGPPMGLDFEKQGDNIRVIED